MRLVTLPGVFSPISDSRLLAACLRERGPPRRARGRPLHGQRAAGGGGRAPRRGSHGRGRVTARGGHRTAERAPQRRERSRGAGGPPRPARGRALRRDREQPPYVPAETDATLRLAEAAGSAGCAPMSSLSRVRILDEQVERYLDGLRPQRSETMAEMEALAERDGVPIVHWEAGRFLATLCRALDPVVLEVGTAIGYSTLHMAEPLERGRVVTLERDPERARPGARVPGARRRGRPGGARRGRRDSRRSRPSRARSTCCSWTPRRASTRATSSWPSRC